MLYDVIEDLSVWGRYGVRIAMTERYEQHAIAIAIPFSRPEQGALTDSYRRCSKLSIAGEIHAVLGGW